MAHVGYAKPSEMVRHITSTGALVIERAAEILLARNTGHLAQVFRNVKTHARRILELVERHLAFRFPLRRLATTDNRARSQVAQVARKRHDHIEQIRIILQVHVHTVVALFLEHEGSVLGIYGKLETAIRRSLCKFLARTVGNLHAIKREVRPHLEHHTHDRRRRRRKKGCHQEQRNKEQGTESHMY